MRFLAFMAALLAGCSNQEPPPTTPAEKTPLVQESAAQPTLPSRQAFPERAANLTPPPPPPAAKPAKPHPPAPPEAAPAPVVPAGPPPLPFTYVGKLVDGKQRYAVLSRDQAVLVVKVGDSVAGRYRVEAVREDQVLLLNLEFRVVQPLAFSGQPGQTGSIRTSTFPVGEGDDASLQLAGPAQVTMGEQFTLTVSLATGANAAIDTGSVEVRFDPKVLQLRGSEGESAVGGAARIDISGAYMGHPAPATVQFRVIAQAPTATEIRVIPSNIADGEGRNLGVETPAAHRLSIVPR